MMLISQVCASPITFRILPTLFGALLRFPVLLCGLPHVLAFYSCSSPALGGLLHLSVHQTITDTYEDPKITGAHDLLLGLYGLGKVLSANNNVTYVRTQTSVGLNPSSKTGKSRKLALRQ